MEYLVIDASLNGTGIRDYYNGGYINLDSLNITEKLKNKIKCWLLKYEDQHYKGLDDDKTITALDQEGKEIALLVKEQLQSTKISYYSHASLKKEEI